MAWIAANWGLVASVCWGICEALSLIPQVKSNSIFTLIVNILKTLLPPGQPPQIK